VFAFTVFRIAHTQALSSYTIHTLYAVILLLIATQRYICRAQRLSGNRAALFTEFVQSHVNKRSIRFGFLIQEATYSEYPVSSPYT
jgi:hypothetical protein